MNVYVLLNVSLFMASAHITYPVNSWSFRLCYRLDVLAYCSALCSLFLYSQGARSSSRSVTGTRRCRWGEGTVTATYTRSQSPDYLHLITLSLTFKSPLTSFPRLLVSRSHLLFRSQHLPFESQWIRVCSVGSVLTVIPQLIELHWPFMFEPTVFISCFSLWK